MKIHSEFVSFNQKLPYLVRIFEEVNFDYPVHYHPDEFEITFTTGCRGTLVAGNNTTSFYDPDLTIAGPGLPHAWYEGSEDRLEKDRKVRVIHFRKNILPEEWLDSQEFRKLHLLLENSFRGIQFSMKSAKKLQTLFEKLREGQSMENYVLILEILNRLALEKGGRQLSGTGLYLHDARKEEERFRNVHAYIVQNFRKDIHLPEVAKIAGLRPSAFSHYFKRHSLKNFSDFIIDLRLNYARELLQNSAMSITQIAFESGFNSISNFNRLFLEKSGMTPSSYRKMKLHR